MTAKLGILTVKEKRREKERTKEKSEYERGGQVFEGHELLSPFQFFTVLNKYLKTAFSREQSSILTVSVVLLI